MNGYAIRFIYDAANLHRGAFFSALGLVFVVKVIGLSLPLVTGRLIDSLNFVTGLSPAEWLFVFIGLWILFVVITPIQSLILTRFVQDGKSWSNQRITLL